MTGSEKLHLGAEIVLTGGYEPFTLKGIGGRNQSFTSDLAGATLSPQSDPSSGPAPNEGNLGVGAVDNAYYSALSVKPDIIIERDGH